jgi:hypothetical protein
MCQTGIWDVDEEGGLMIRERGTGRVRSINGAGREKKRKEETSRSTELVL